MLLHQVLFLILLWSSDAIGREPSKNVSPKQGFFASKFLSKFQSLKNFIANSIPSAGQRPVLYKPYLNFRPEGVNALGSSELNAPGSSQVNDIRPDEFSNPGENLDTPGPFDTRQKGTKFSVIRNWKKEKKQKIQDVKEALQNKVDADQAAAAAQAQSLAQRRQMAILRRHHMHGVVDEYRPMPVAAPGSGWGWNEPVKRPKPKKKKAKKKKKKKPKKKKQKKKMAGWSEQESAPVPSLGWPSTPAPTVGWKPAPKTPKKKKVKTKTKKKGGWREEEGQPFEVKITTTKKPNLKVDPIPPAAGSRINSDALTRVVIKQSTPSVKSKAKNTKSLIRKNDKILREDISHENFAQRTGDLGGSNYAAAEDSTAIVQKHNLEQKLKRRSGMPAQIMSAEDDSLEENRDAVLLLRRMPFLFYEDSHETSVYSPY